MKAILTVNGKELEVMGITFFQDKVLNVQVDCGDNVYKTYYDENSLSFADDALKINMEEALEFPDLEQRIMEANNKLIEHLEKFQSDEDEYLTRIAIDAMEGKLPFVELELVEKQKEYKLRQQRVLGVLDTVEEVKAFMEGWYKDDEGASDE